MLLDEILSLVGSLRIHWRPHLALPFETRFVGGQVPLPPLTRTQELAQWLPAQGLLTPRLARLPHCRSWMIFRHYPELDLIRLANTRSCDLSLLCPLCAIRRAARASSAYQQRVQALLARNPGL